MKKSKRISISLFDEELKSLINASAKIFPISEDYISNNINPNNYEYAKVGRKIYTWIDNSWQYVIADDIDIKWSDINDKPTLFLPLTHIHNEVDIANLDKYTKTEINNKLIGKSDVLHGHDGLHVHDNKSVLNLITETLINTWNTVTGKADANHTHTKSNITDFTHTHVENDITNLDKYTKLEVDTKLIDKSSVAHNHDGAYYKKSEVDSKLSFKSNSNHIHDELHLHDNKSLLDKLTETSINVDYDLSDLQYIADIRAGYTEGHSHINKNALDIITQMLIDSWNSAVMHISDAVKHITSGERTLWNTVSNKSDSGHTHNYSPNGHIHDDRYYTETEVDTSLSNKSDVGHIHDDKYYTESEINTLLAGKAENTTLSGHIGNTITHVTQIDKNNWDGKQEFLGFVPVNTNDSRMSDARAPTSHNHIALDISDFPIIPSTTNDLINNSGFITLSDVPEPPPGYTIGSIKPTNGSLWFKKI